jgi:elongation factor G
LHRQLIEHIAESDDELMNKFFEKGGLSEEEFRAGIHTAVQRELFIPLFVTSAENNIGVARLMDFIAKYGSSPAGPQEGQGRGCQWQRNGGGLGRSGDRRLHLQDHVRGPFWRAVVFPRLFRLGPAGKDLFNSDRKVNERIGQIYLLNGQTARPSHARRGRHRRGGETQGHAHRQHACAPPNTR